MPSKKSKRNKKALLSQPPDLVGPDYIQVLTGKVLNKKVTIVLCGESHEDAIDVTRSGGFFKPKEGWIPESHSNIAEEAAIFATKSMGPSVGTYKLTHEIWHQKSKLSSVEKAKEFGVSVIESNDLLDNVDNGDDILLIWMKDKSSSSKKGMALVVKVAMNDFDKDGNIILDEYDTSSDDDTNSSSVKKPSKFTKSQGKSGKEHDILDDITSEMNHIIFENLYGNEENEASKQSSNQSGLNKNSKYTYKDEFDYEILIFAWGDLDDEARHLNRQRILLTCSDDNEEMSTVYYDSIIKKRKKNLQEKENIWTFDDWFSKIKKIKKEANDDLHLILETSIPPWEVELCRDGPGGEEYECIPEAADCIRCLSEDSDGSSTDDFDPSTDGIGSYLDFINRKFMDDDELKSNDNGTKEEQEICDGNDDLALPNKSWLHCVDSRDLGCESARVSESLKKGWTKVLLPEEQTGIKEKINGSETTSSIVYELEKTPKWAINPEYTELLRLNDTGSLQKYDSDIDDDSENDGDINSVSNKNERKNIYLEDISFPSFEGFFGQNTDVLYYTLNVKALYAPFLAKCVGSLTNWEKFFINLFFGGTIPEALSQLNLNDANKKFSHVRSPIQKVWNEKKKEFEWSKRSDEEGNVTFPYLPYNCYLKAKASEPPRTWSSSLFSRLTLDDSKGMECKNLAISARKWILDSIQKYSNDPKNSDDKQGGGEWFLAFLRANHRDIYDDIDRSDPSTLLSKKVIKSEEGDGKYNIGKIKIPSCQSGFDTMVKELETLEKCSGIEQRKLVSSNVEIMSKILIDIWMSNLVDFNALLKIIEIIANAKSENVTIICYMGSVHTKAVSHFLCNVVGLTRKFFVGEYDWDEDASRLLVLSSKLWNLEGF